MHDPTGSSVRGAIMLAAALALQATAMAESPRSVDPRLSADEARYSQAKLDGAPVPVGLRELLFPAAGRTRLADRDGGDGPAAATIISAVAWGDCTTDQGTTVDKSNTLTNPIQPPPASCDYGYFDWTSFSANDAWYRFTLTQATQAVVNTCLQETTYDTAIAILDENLVPVAVDEDIPFCEFDWWRSYLECCLDAGTYYLVIDGYDSWSVGDYAVEICFNECPPDPCIAYNAAVTTAEIPGILSGDSSLGVDVIYHDGLPEQGYALTVAETGIYTFNACSENTASDVALYLYDANPCEGGFLIAAANWGECGMGHPWAATLSNVPLAAGVYHLTVSSSSQPGVFEINVFSPCELYNEEIAHITAPGTVTGNSTAGVDIIYGPGPDAGIEVTIPSAGFWDMDACQAGTVFDASLHLFDANPCLGGQLIAESIWSNCNLAWGSGRLRDIWLEPGAVHLTVSNSWFNAGEFEVAIQPSPERPSQAGPDATGYTWTNSDNPDGPDFAWVDISEVGTSLLIWEDSYDGPIDMEIDFPFYEGVWDEVYICSNGFISFGAGYASMSHMPFPYPSDGWTPDNFIAPYWDDLIVNQGGAIYYHPDPANARFIVAFHDVFTNSNPNLMTFEVILHESADIEILYLDIAEGAWSMMSAGIENSDSSIGLQYIYDGDGGILRDGLAVFYDAPEGDFQPPMVSHDNPQADVEAELPGGYPIEAEITDLTGIALAEVVYQVDGGVELSAAMTLVQGDIWRGTIPHQQAGSQVDYRIRAVDTAPLVNERNTMTWTFHVLSFHWPPTGLTATDGLPNYTFISWLPPMDPDLLNRWFGTSWPTRRDEAVERLMREHGLDKSAAQLRWRELCNPAGREFLEYRVYRNGALLGGTPIPQFQDDAAQGSQMDVSYNYTVTAVYDAGESGPSNTDAGYWGSPPSFGGPDAFGYMWINSSNVTGPDYAWVDISALGQQVDLEDDSFAGPLALGFSFPFYGNSYDECYIGSNGYVSFGAGYISLNPTPFPTPSDGWSPDNFVAALWQDLNPGAGGAVYTWQDTINERFIVQFQAVPPYGGEGMSFTFQFIFSASGAMLIQYEAVDENWATWSGAGIENADGTIGLQYFLYGEGALIADHVAVLYTPPSNCEPVECQGIAESEPNEGWTDDNQSWNLIRCGQTVCGTVQATPQDSDTDWFLYTHFGGNIAVSLDVSDFNGRISLRQQALNGQTLIAANTFPRCYNEAFAFPDLPGGTYYLVVEHAGAADVPDPQSYALTLTCSGDPCSGHQPISCSGTAEVEPNEGWNAVPPNSSYGEIGLNQTVCGTVWANNGQRDMDWFRFTLSAPVDVSISVAVDAFDPALFITEIDPAGEVLAEVDDAPACAPETITWPGMPAGEYYVVVGHNSLSGVPVAQNYALTLTAGTFVDPCTGYQDLGDFHDIVTLSRPAPAVFHHSGSGCPGGITSPGMDEVTRLVLAQSTDLRITMQGEGQADEVILLLGNCAQPATSCGAAVNDFGAGAGGEVLSLAGLPAGDYYIVADFAGASETHPYVLSVIDMESGVDGNRDLSFALESAHPNPFNPSTTIAWTQPKLAEATLTVHDLRGAVVEELDLGLRGPGRHSIVWNAARLGSGVYFCTLTAGAENRTMKVLLAK